MNSGKNTTVSIDIRQRGNKSFLELDYFEALVKYNEALRYAEPKTKELGLCYSNRSAIYLKVRQYEACLKNIQWARDNNYPLENASKLNEREKECKKQMKAHKGPIESSWNELFHLTYEANPNYPYLSRCLELKKNECGMFLATNRDLKSGDIIGITEPFFRMPIDTSSYRCNYCLADKFLNFIPCSGCTQVMFCNKICMKKATMEFHQFECGIFDNPSILSEYITPLRMIMKCVSLFDGSRKEMEKFLKANKKDKLRTPFDFNLKNPSSLGSERNLMLTQLCGGQTFQFNCCMDESFKEIKPFLKRHPKLRKIATSELFTFMMNVAHQDRKFFKSIDGKILSNVHEQLGICTINYYGSALDVCFQLFRYSCAPNVFLHPYNGKLVWIVLYPIEAGDWLTVAYLNTVFYEETHEHRIEGTHHFIDCCKCPACVGCWDIVPEVDIRPVIVMRYTSEKAVEEFTKYCNYINENFKPLVRGKCDNSVWLAISHFRWNLYAIGKATFWNVIPKLSIQNSSNDFWRS